MKALSEDIDPTVMAGKVVRPLRSVDPSQTEYQGLIEVMEEGQCLGADGGMLRCTALAIGMSTVLPWFSFQGPAKARKYPSGS